MGENKAVETLLKLGLTVLQAKVYLALATSGPYTGRATATATNIATNDVYRVLCELQAKGLVEKIINKPTMYKATQINEGLAALLQNKKDEYIKTEKEVQILSQTIVAARKKAKAPQFNTQFTITSQFKMLIKMHENLAQTCSQSIDFITPVTKQALYEYPEYLDLAVNKNVKVRAVTINQEKTEFPKNPFFEVRALPAFDQPIGMHIFDGKQLTIAITEEATPSLWTNNAHIVRIAKSYFEELWSKAK